VRRLNEVLSYGTSKETYRVILIDEVHMLTKEAFNALLKTLEEPPAAVKFFFATTEPSKVLPTILSRCQRFQLSAIAEDALTNKLQTIASDLKRDITPEGLTLLAKRAEGGLRDAESLLDQVLAFHDGPITEETVAAILGLVPSDLYFRLDQAGKTGDFKIAFEISEQLFREGKELNAFLDGLIDHFRAILKCYWSPNTSRHNTSKDLYTQSQCLDILEDLVKTQSNIRHAPSPRFALEALLLRILRSHHKISLDQIVHKLHNLQSTPAPTPQAKPSSPTPQPPPTPAPQPKPAAQTPSAPAPQPKPLSPTPPSPSETPFAISPSTQPRSKEEQSRLDTLFQFAAAELNGSVEKK
ncbi:MAG: AAA family ATPase, partial [Chlamydiia bacterium]|nr:AAA family ATPase [Chlamydiia bacterium]